MRIVTLLFCLLIAGLAGGLYWASFAYFKAGEIERAEARLSLYRNTLVSELRHFAHLPFLVSLDPVVQRTLQSGENSALDYRLARFAQSAGLDAMYLMDHTGLTIAASNARSANSFKGQNYAFRPYFQAARRGELGEFYGIGATTGIPGYFYAMAVRPPEQDETGVIAIKVDLSELQEAWQAAGERIMLTNADGVVLLASEPDWRYRTLAPLSETARARILASRQFGAEPLAPLDWDAEPATQVASVQGTELLYLQTADLPNSWSLHFFVPQDAVITRAALSTGAFLALVLMSVSVLQVTRLRRIGVALKASEREESALRSANARLAVEIEERRSAERTLRRTQAELERAGRLAALGQLASSVTHELGQPIAAMRNQLTAAEMTAGPTRLGDKMQGLVARMENITQQLKFFSRKGRDSFETCALDTIIADALELLEPSIAASGAVIEQVTESGDLGLYANRLRIEQVVTNIVRNGLDAVAEMEDRRVQLRSGGTADTVWFEVEDSGHGLGDRSFDDLREPFATTRESGHGMGLGLTISAGIVADHGGSIEAHDAPMGGACFRVCLPRGARTEAAS
ncbi:sensor histidine kinase [Roseobacteraceae bacterium S113]